MANESGQDDLKLYIDYKKTGGVIHSQPPRTLGDLVIPTGKLITEAEKAKLSEKEDLLTQNGISLVGFARFGRNIYKSLKVARRLFLSLNLPKPGLIDVGDKEKDCYSGWFFVDTNRGVKKLNTRGDIRIDPYFMMNSDEALGWNRVISSRPLRLSEFDQLKDLPSVTTHPMHERLLALSNEQFLQENRAYIQSFWDKLLNFKKGEVSPELAVLGKTSVLPLALMSRVSQDRYDFLLQTVQKEMVAAGVTLITLSDESALVGYINRDGNFDSRTLPFPKDLPQAQLAWFKRYFQAQRPLKYDELKYLYGIFVGPTGRLFG